MRTSTALLHVGHALDHFFLLIFATAIGAIAKDFGLPRWEDLMPYGAGAFFLFGLGALPAGRLSEVWGRQRLMTVFFLGVGVSSILVSMTTGPWQLAGALSMLGMFGAIYHPVGIPLLVQHCSKPGSVLGLNALAGNLGVAAAAVVTGFLIEVAGWRAAFLVPGILSLLAGVAFHLKTPESKAVKKSVPIQKRIGADQKAANRKILLTMTAAAACSGIIFQFATNGNAQLLLERMDGYEGEPAFRGALLAAMYVTASFAQIGVGRLMDRFPIKHLYVAISLVQIPIFLMARSAHGWSLFISMLIGTMLIFAAIPFTDALIVKYVEDERRSSVAGARFTISFSLSATAVWLLGPIVKGGGFNLLFFLMTCLSAMTLLVVSTLPPQARNKP